MLPTMLPAAFTASILPLQASLQAESDKVLPSTTSNHQDQPTLPEELPPIRVQTRTSQLPELLQLLPTAPLPLPPPMELPLPTPLETLPLLPPLTAAQLAQELPHMELQAPLEPMVLAELLEPPLASPPALTELAETLDLHQHTEPLELLVFLQAVMEHQVLLELTELAELELLMELLELAASTEPLELVLQLLEHLELLDRTPAVCRPPSATQDCARVELTTHSKPRSFEND